MAEIIKNIVQKIKDSQQAQIKLTTQNGKQLSLNCIFKESDAPRFFLAFPPNILPDKIDTQRKHPVSVVFKNSSISLSSTITAIKSDRTLELVANETVDPASLREYFRVNITTPIKANFEVKDPTQKQKNWALTGSTLDLSGTGALALFPQEPLNINNIYLTIQLPGTPTTIRAVAHVVRKRKLRRERWQVAFHFDVISEKHRDQLIQCCLQEQRKQLRQNVQML